jgi:hypothetical protein
MPLSLASASQIWLKTERMLVLKSAEKHTVSESIKDEGARVLIWG